MAKLYLPLFDNLLYYYKISKGFVLFLNLFNLLQTKSSLGGLKIANTVQQVATEQDVLLPMSLHALPSY